LVGHVADVIVEAWGTTRVACLEEAVRGLIESFAEVEDVSPTGRVAVALRAVGDDEVLVSLLEEAIYAVEVLGQVPVRVHLDATRTASCEVPSRRSLLIGSRRPGRCPRGSPDRASCASNGIGCGVAERSWTSEQPRPGGAPRTSGAR
jgi:hypothetical protein